MTFGSLRLALVVPVAAAAAIFAPAAHAHTTPTPVGEETAFSERDYKNCPDKHVCAYSQPLGKGNQWAKHQNERRCHNLPWAGRSVYNRTDKRITFHRNPDCKGKRFTLDPGQKSGYAGGQPMDEQVWSITIP
ncbi:peptidase inhibitor family I36 protein [Saccharothrix tamanrassetensis]|nr:peptidase inhibitor family I36 protein [Saccharothrix tamanrassetensis]